MSLLSRSIGYLFLVPCILPVVFGGNGIATACCAVAQAVLLVMAHRWPGPTRPVLVAQVVATYLPIAFFHTAAVDLDGLLAATVALGPGRRSRWLAFGAVVVAAGPLDHGLHASATAYLHAAIGTAAVGLVLSSLLRLPDLVDQLDSTQEELTRVIRAEERFRVARELRAGLGEQLLVVMDRLRLVRREMAESPDRACRTADDVADRTRTIVAMMRRTTATQRDFDRPATDRAPVARLAPRLTLAALVASLLAISANQVMEVPQYQVLNAAGGLAFSALLLAQVLRARFAVPLLRVQLALTVISLLWLGPSWCSWLSLLAVAALLRQRAPWVVAAIGFFALRAVFTEPTGALADRTSWVLLALQTILVLFGLSRFHQLSTQLNRSRAELATRTAHLERLRLARDIHDLLGLTLSVLALKCDLISELISRDPRRAASEIDQALRIAADAQFEALALTDDRAALSLRNEFDSARTILAAAIATVSIDCDDDLPERADTVLALVVREAVTNVLRHSTATRVEIHCRSRNQNVQMNIHNDGVGATAAADGSGQGLRNMRARVLDAGGSFTTSTGEGEFRLEAAAPC
ncbi:sensor histidine kinase [Nocardia crassostreae]|uniref:sensor histidine kinase n=1 Tax=Nocardia crassostreae TaxID=53428 RepID=UPI00082A0FD5|nr:histidine kinase [Nocardia crassostreae]